MNKNLFSNGFFIAISLIFAMFLGTAPFVNAGYNSNVDLQTYGVKNITRGESYYSQNINASAGDEIEFSVVIKNTSASLARNAYLSVYLPSSLPLTTNSISIDGTKTTKNLSNGLFIGNVEAGAIKEILFRTKARDSLGNYSYIQAQTSGDNFFVASGYVSITNTSELGNSSGSSPTPSPTPSPSTAPKTAFLTISQLGKNLTKKDTVWVKTVQAEPGDTLQFSIMLTGNSAKTVKSVYLQEKLDNLLRFTAGTVTNDGAAASDQLAEGSLFIGDISSGQVKFIKLQAKVKSASELGGKNIILANIATATASNADDVTSNTGVNVKVKATATVSPTPTPTSSPKATPSPSPKTIVKKTVVKPSPSATPKPEQETLDVLKIAKNITQGQKVPTEQIQASPGDELEFTIQITSTSDRKLEKVIAKDVFPKEMDYTFNSARMDEKLISDDIVRDSGFELGSLNPKQTKIITYRARVLPEKEFKDSKTEIKNSVEVQGENTVKAKGSVQILIKSKNINFLGGLIAFGDLGFLLLLILILIILLLITFLHKEKRKNRNGQNLA